MTALFSPRTPGHLRVDIWSDIACPWCYIGKRRLESALAQFEHRDRVEVVWRSFELDPAAPPALDQTMGEVLAKKYGRSPAQVQAMMDQVTAVAAAEGLSYHFDRARLGSTFLAHQLIHHAALHGQQGDMKERLLRAYFSEGARMGDLETLTALAEEVGLDSAAARTALSEGRHADAVRQDEAQAQALGISGVPFFVLGGKYGVSGAQDPQVLLGALQQAWAEVQPPALVTLGDADHAGACEDGVCAVPEPAAR
ncbi:DsbA family oxidoreductase [Deinococcus multiflagellatus]|uniref:DsbA family oxidoreductase n=1 Tax=Deinococcus multiflagellatus TaxID=1656887 RepID=A0ABW1ZP47_9DEIO|nr:DsbA family oxidoreductase [Deinococcus multiflagellatus]MBZ9716125.1 DsbA family oxidoreductase [Deinococcus multiflagellatus]